MRQRGDLVWSQKFDRDKTKQLHRHSGEQHPIMAWTRQAAYFYLTQTRLGKPHGQCSGTHILQEVFKMGGF